MTQRMGYFHPPPGAPDKTPRQDVWLVNAREESIANRYTEQGWKVLRGGAPDFLMLKVVDGEIGDVKAVEVKSFEDELTYEQALYRMILERAGFEYIVELVD